MLIVAITDILIISISCWCHHRYDLKVGCGASSNRYRSSTPGACFFFADNLVVIDHSNGDVYILSIHETCHPYTRKGSEEITKDFV